VQQSHHFVSTAPWATAPLEAELAHQAAGVVGGPDAGLVVDDTALVTKGQHAAGVAHQYRGRLGKQANCHVLVSLTLARRGAGVRGPAALIALRSSCPRSGRVMPIGGTAPGCRRRSR